LLKIYIKRQTKQAMYIKRNTEAGLCNHCCFRKWISIKILYASVCVLL